MDREDMKERFIEKYLEGSKTKVEKSKQHTRMS